MVFRFRIRLYIQHSLHCMSIHHMGLYYKKWQGLQMFWSSELMLNIQILYSIWKYFTNNDLFRKGGIDVIAKRRRCICWTYIVSVYIIDVPNYYSLASFFSFAFFNSIFECTELITSRITVCVGAVFEIVLWNID